MLAYFTSMGHTMTKEQEKGYYYGGEFIGISDSNAVKIDIYQVFHDI